MSIVSSIMAQTSRYAQYVYAWYRTFTKQNRRNNEHITYKEEGPTTQYIGTFYVYDLSKRKLEINDTYTDTHNPIFDLLINISTKMKNIFTSHHTPLTSQNYTTPIPTPFPETWRRLLPHIHQDQ
jgi:hypothetical protein